MDKSDLLKITMSTTPEGYPDYLIGEDKNWEKFNKYLDTFLDVKKTFGGSIQGVTGNGKTHFIKYAKGALKDKYNVFIIEDMFSQSDDFLTSLRNIYGRLIKNDNDTSFNLQNIVGHLKNIDKQISDVKKEILKKAQSQVQLPLIDPLYDELAKLETIERYQSRILNILRKNISDEDASNILVRLFSGEAILNTQEKAILKQLNLYPNLINSESDFVDYFVDYLELVFAITNKPCIIFMDEADRSLVSTKEVILPKVAFQILDSLREVFNKLRTPTFFTIGTTTQAWQLIGNAVSAFARRFDSFHILLKEKKSINDIRNLIKIRTKELNMNEDYFFDNKFLNDRDLTNISLASRTWRDVINNLRTIGENKDIQIKTFKVETTADDIEFQILTILYTYRALTASDIISYSDVLKSQYKSNNLPPTVINSLLKKKYLTKLKTNKSSPYTYKITSEGDEFITRIKENE